jgi:hypothetical protein
MPRITIFYRRDDSLDITGRIYDRLAGHFGREAVFRDIDDIPPGADFRRHIDRVIDASDIVLAIMGPRWIGPDDEQRRLASPDDPVRLEIETALRKNKPLIPVLVSRAVMPPQDELPDSLHDFGYLNAVQVDSGQDFDFHVGRLIRAVEAVPRIEPPPTAEPPVAPVAPPVGWLVQAIRDHTVRWAIGLGLVVMLGAICVADWRMSFHQQAVAAEKARAEEQVRQAATAAKAQVEDALEKGKAEALDSKVFAEATPLYRMAADQGNTEAQGRMGWFYEYGRGVSRDYAEAMRWYRKAADQGDPDGQVAVGLLYEHGRGVSQDYAEAMRWYRKAADQGNHDAQNLIGTLYLKGFGVPRDPEQASQWFLKARDG